MHDGLDRVWRAAEALVGSDAGLRERLQAARTELAAALRRPELWPAGLLHQARSIERLLREDGAVDPLDTLPSALARQVAEDILALAADVALYAERYPTAVPMKETGAALSPGRNPSWLRTPRSATPPSVTTSAPSATI